MKETKCWHINDHIEKHSDDLAEAAALIKEGELVAFPTETVYGLGADATNDEAVASIFQAKGRPQDNPLIAHVASKEQLKSLVTELPDYVDALLDAFSPGPLTYVLPSNGKCAAAVTAGLETVAVRIPEHPVALALIEASGKPLAAPSANTSGKPSPTEAAHVSEDLTGKIAGLIDGGETGIGVESTVLDCTTHIPTILRPGGVTKADLEAVIGRVQQAEGEATPEAQPASPGIKYRHYRPAVPLTILRTHAEDMQAYIDRKRSEHVRIGLLATDQLLQQLEADKKVSLGSDLASVAKNLYRGLRAFSKTDVDEIICESFPKEGIGVAVMNRLERAAEKSQ